MSNTNVLLGPEARVVIAQNPFGVTDGSIRITGDVPEKSDTESYPYKRFGQRGMVSAEIDISFQAEQDRPLHTAVYAIFPGFTIEVFVLPKWDDLVNMYYFQLLVVRDFTHGFSVNGSPPQPGRISGVATGEFRLPQDGVFAICTPKEVVIPAYGDLIAALPACDGTIWG